MFTRPSRKTIAGFLLAPLVAVGLSSVLLGAGFILGIFVGVPLAYGAALLFGPPLLVLFRKVHALSLSCFIVGGAAIAVPLIVAYLVPGNTHTELHGPVEAAFLISVGALGGAAFWFITVRPEHPSVSKGVARAGLASAWAVFAVLVFLAFVPRTTELAGIVLGPEQPFEHRKQSTIQVQLTDGPVVTAVLPDLVPFRMRCPVHLYTRRSLLTLQPLYWVTWYTDDVAVTNVLWHPQGAKGEAKKSC